MKSPDEDDPVLAAMIQGFGDRLRSARLALGFRQQAAFARDIGVSVHRYNHWEQGRHPPGPHYLALIKSKYSVGPDWILCADYASLPVRVLQAMVTQGVAAAAPGAAQELRRALPDLPDPAPGRRTLHQPVSPAPGRLIRHFDRSG